MVMLLERQWQRGAGGDIAIKRPIACDRFRRGVVFLSAELHPSHSSNNAH